jgi:hypothetical protein
MAEKNQIKRVDPVDFGDDDPFAELTRIMGFDPRSAGRPEVDANTAELEAADLEPMDFDIDLEKELMGDLSFDVEAPAGLAEADDMPADEAAAPDSVELDLDDLGLDEAFDDVLGNAELHADDDAGMTAAATAAPELGPELETAANDLPPHVAETGEADIDAGLGDASVSNLDEELSLDPHEAIEAQSAESVEGDLVGDVDFDLTAHDGAAVQDDAEDVLPEMRLDAESAPAPAAASEVDETDPLSELVDLAVQPLNDPASHEVDMAEVDAERDFEAAGVPAAAYEEVAPDAARHDTGADFDIAMADVDMDFNADPSAAPYDPEQPIEQVSSNAPMATPYGVSHVTAESSDPQEINLEDELNALLGNSVPRTELSGGYDASPLNLHVDADAAASRDDAEPVASYDDEYAGPSYAIADAAADDADTAYADDGAYEADASYEAAPESELDLEFEDSHFQAAFDDTLDAHADVVDDGSDAVRDENPFDALREMAAAREKADAARNRVFQSVSVAPEAAQPPADAFGDDVEAAAADDSGAPDIETIEVPEGAIAVEDDLDIPELEYQEDVAVAAPYDEFESDFASAYQDIAQPAEPVRSATAVAGFGAFAQSYSRGPAAAIGNRQPDAPASEPVSGVADDEAFADEFGAELFDAMSTDEKIAMRSDDAVYEDADFADDGADPFQVAETPAFVADRSVRQGRGLMIAGIVLGVAVLGGVGAFALSFGDNGASDVPAVVKADADPIKVRPKNPGGATVPNQDNKVYETVANGARPAAPEQKKLISSSEELADVEAQAIAPRVVTPPQEIAAAADPIAEIASKGEYRLSPSTDAESAAEKSTVAAVAPRRVRTMIVREDGTLVPREEDEPETASLGAEPEAGSDAMPIEPTKNAQAPAEAVASADPAADVTETTGSTTPVENTRAAEVVNSPTAVSKVVPSKPSVMPDTVALAPSRPADQPVDIVGEVKPDQVAAIKPSAAAAAGPWTVQIASQPSEEAAKASYQDLSRRYASVIGDKGVTIVKADIAGKGTYWRVRIPAGDRNAAINLCENYKSAGGNCFVSK